MELSETKRLETTPESVPTREKFTSPSAPTQKPMKTRRRQHSVGYETVVLHMCCVV